MGGPRQEPCKSSVGPSGQEGSCVRASASSPQGGWGEKATAHSEWPSGTWARGRPRLGGVFAVRSRGTCMVPNHMRVSKPTRYFSLLITYKSNTWSSWPAKLQFT